MSYSHSCKPEELQTPEALQQSVASGARFVIQHLPPLEASLPSLTVKSAPIDSNEELPDLAAAALSLESAQDALIKPHVSFPCLIALAILDSPAQKLTVSEIYEWIKARFPYYGTPAAGLGWKNSVRHNLSLNRHFIKKSRDEDDIGGGKGAPWAVRLDSMGPLVAAIARQSKIYSRYGGGLAVLAAAPPSDDEWRRSPRPPLPSPAPAPIGRRRMDRDATTDAAAALVALHAALPAVKGRAGTRRPGPAHSASLRFYPEPRRMPEPMQASATMSPRIARDGEPTPSPAPGSDEGIGATPDISPRKRSNSGSMVYTFSAPLSIPDTAMRLVPDGRRSPPHARRRLAMRRDSLDEEPVCDALSAGAALLTLAMQPIDAGPPES